MITFKIGDNNELYIVDNIFANKEGYITVDENSLPDAVYPYYKLDENNNIIVDSDRILDKAKSIKINQLENDYNIALNCGFQFEYNNDTYLIDSSYEAQINIIGLLLAVLLDSSFTTYFYTADNREISLDADGIKQLYSAGVTYKQGLVAKFHNIYDSIVNETDVNKIITSQWDETLTVDTSTTS